MDPVVDVVLEPGLRYTETIESGAGNRSMRYCRLVADEDTPVGELEVHSFRWRFGAVAVDAEGIGGVEVQPSFRRRGHMSRLLRQALDGMSRRVNVATVSDGIQGVYEKFGFVMSVAEGHLDIHVRDIERAAAAAMLAAVRVRPGSAEDLPAMVDLYNSTHAHRPWTHERPADWNRLVPQTTWRAGSEILVVEAGGTLAGYAIVAGRSFGDSYFGLTVQEMAARDTGIARCLLADIARSAWELRVSEFRVREPLDGVVGRLARHLGCGYKQEFPPTGGMMAAILNRSELLATLEPELRRRDRDAADAAMDELARGELIPDNGLLVRLLLGYSSAADASTPAATIPARHRRTCSAWFPGGSTATLPMPYAHALDRY
ncbi:GCN5-related N-acetyltransferase [Parafrankia sp. EAN1pec]|uniref:GNAT family N-acetyltransferase n=1 Tax=Parafrankia sp. (strain EAN1pec) TaxID=298653 RepID=UPI0000541E37|nr:GCN5-related N-acetyltransferase [Frankia sp. EAN1pec]